MQQQGAHKFIKYLIYVKLSFFELYFTLNNHFLFMCTVLCRCRWLRWFQKLNVR
jgi:hypothetical protein